MSDFMVGPVPVCEVCWLKAHMRLEPVGVDEDGTIMAKVVELNVPEKMNMDAAEVCATCGKITIAGIYEFRDINLVNGAAEVDD